MAKYIDKAAVAAEIKKMLDKYNKLQSFNYGAVKDLESLLNFLNTLEVKEVDLEKEIDYADYVRFFKEHPDYNDCSWGFEETWTFAQYCYKLGLKAQKGE